MSVVETESGEKIANCSVCGELVSSKNSKVVEELEEGEKYSCPYCYYGIEGKTNNEEEEEDG